MDLIKARISWGSNNLFLVITDEGQRLLCALKGKRVKNHAGQYNSLVAGDLVTVSVTEEDRGLIHELLPRRNSFGRFNEKGGTPQAIAANVDQVLCISSSNMPPFRPRFIDRIAVSCEIDLLPLIIVLNKTDLGVSEEVGARLDNYAGLGYTIMQTSINSPQSYTDLRALLAGKVSVLVGQSGVGKSSLLNMLDPTLERATDEVSLKFERGRHTTTMAELFPLHDSSLVIDTPGFRRLALRGIELGHLANYFPELVQHLTNCEFPSCSHQPFEKNCAVLAAVEKGEVHPDRYESYLRIYEELQENKSYTLKKGKPRRIWDDGDEDE